MTHWERFGMIDRCCSKKLEEVDFQSAMFVYWKILSKCKLTWWGFPSSKPTAAWLEMMADPFMMNLPSSDMEDYCRVRWSRVDQHVPTCWVWNMCVEYRENTIMSRESFQRHHPRGEKNDYISYSSFEIRSRPNRPCKCLLWLQGCIPPKNVCGTKILSKKCWWEENFQVK